MEYLVISKAFFLLFYLHKASYCCLVLLLVIFSRCQTVLHTVTNLNSADIHLACHISPQILNVKLDICITGLADQEETVFL